MLKLEQCLMFKNNGNSWNIFWHNIIYDSELGLLHIEYRHHILQIVAGRIFNKVMDFSSDQQIQLRSSNYPSDEFTVGALADIKDTSVMFQEKALREKQSKGNHKDVINLAVLHPVVEHDSLFLKPCNNAVKQCMTIYTFKAWMFYSKFTMTAQKESYLICEDFSR